MILSAWRAKNANQVFVEGPVPAQMILIALLLQIKRFATLRQINAFHALSILSVKKARPVRILSVRLQKFVKIKANAAVRAMNVFRVYVVVRLHVKKPVIAERVIYVHHLVFAIAQKNAVRTQIVRAMVFAIRV